MKAIKALRVCAVIACISMLTATPSFAGDWVGKYVTEDTHGEPMRIMLTKDGKAAGERQGLALTGTWKEEGDAAWITWTTGWTTRLRMDGDRYTKSAYRVGTSMDEGPTHTASAEKVE